MVREPRAYCLQAAAQQTGDPKRVASYLGNLKGAYTQCLARLERLAKGWEVVQEAAHVYAPGYDLVLAKGAVYRLVETEARASLSLADLHNCVFKAEAPGGLGELRFSNDHFLGNLKQADPNAFLRSGNSRIEFHLNGPDGARLAQGLLAQMGGITARYEYPRGDFHEVQIILTAVSR